jgi:hypothetical protein
MGENGVGTVRSRREDESSFLAEVTVAAVTVQASVAKMGIDVLPRRRGGVRSEAEHGRDQDGGEENSCS